MTAELEDKKSGCEGCRERGEGPPQAPNTRGPASWWLGARASSSWSRCPGHMVEAVNRCVQGRQGHTSWGWRLGAVWLPGLGVGTGHLPRSQLLGGGLAPWEAGRGGAATFPRRGLSGPQSVPSLREPPLCAKGQQVWFPLGWGVGPPLGQQPGPSAAPYPSLGFQHLLLPHGDSRPGWRWEPLCPPPEDRAPAGGWTVTEAAARPRVGSINPAVAAAGASITPTLQTGQ